MKNLILIFSLAVLGCASPREPVPETPDAPETEPKMNCWQLTQCVGQAVGDEARIAECRINASDQAFGKFTDVLMCIDAHRCSDTECVLMNCEREIIRCSNDSATGACNGNSCPIR